MNKDGDILIICLYVDDMIFTGNNPSMFADFKRSMVKEFEMTDVGLMAYFLGVEVNQKVESLSHKISMQGGYSKGLR